jgi:hypothetical protein
MPGPIVVPDGFLCTLLWVRGNGIQPRNVLGFTCVGSTSHVGTVIAANLNANMFAIMSSSNCFDTISVLPLDGSSASVPFHVSPTICGGSGGGDVVPALAAIVSAKTAFRGPKNRGRVYLGPVPESKNTNGVLDGATITSVQNGWNAFLAGCLTASPPVVPAVISRKHLSAEPITSYFAEGTGGTQRRRQDQLR